MGERLMRSIMPAIRSSRTLTGFAAALALLSLFAEWIALPGLVPVLKVFLVVIIALALAPMFRKGNR